MASPDSFRKDFTHLPILLFQRNEGMAKIPNINGLIMKLSPKKAFRNSCAPNYGGLY
jgi:hypothetical protein